MRKYSNFAFFASNSTAPSIIFITHYSHTKLFSGLWPFLICTNEENCAWDFMEIFLYTILRPIFGLSIFCFPLVPLSFYESLFVYIYLSLSLCLFPSLYSSVSLYLYVIMEICPSVSLCLSFSVSLCFSLYLYVSLSLCLSPSLSQ